MSRLQAGSYNAVASTEDLEADLGHTDHDDDLEFHQSNFEADDPSRPLNAPSQSVNGQAANLGSFASAQPQSPGSTASHLFSISFYTPYFDIDTNDVLSRIRLALDPRKSFLESLSASSSSSPDLYGPIWIASTTVLILFLTGTISSYLASQGKRHFEYDFRLLSGAAGLVYGYTLLVPLAVWAVLKYLVGRNKPDIPGMEVGGGAQLVELWALYGYGNVIWIPVALISWSNVTNLNWIFVGIGLGVSGTILFRNMYPLVNATDVQTAKILLVVVMALHVGLAAMIKFTFFAHATPLKSVV